MQRYKQITEILSKERPKTILEVGTWNGVRALLMMQAAGGEIYYGFDLFESGTPELDKSEFNAKPRQTKEQVESRLRGRFNFCLYEGNTRHTLPEFVKNCPEPFIDFAYIDGGHSVETIQSDWDNVKQVVKPGGLVIFDDYYVGMSEERINEVGCNRVVEKLKHELLPQIDPVIGGGGVQLVVVRND